MFFAEQGSKGSMLAQVDALRSGLDDVWERQVGLYEADRAAGFVGGPFPERRHINAINMAFLFEVGEAVRRWAAWVAEATAEWPEDLSVPDGADELLAAVFALRPYEDAEPPRPVRDGDQ